MRTVTYCLLREFLPQYLLGKIKFSTQPVRISLSFVYIYIYIFFFFWAVLGLRCCAWTFSSCGERGLLFVVVRRLLIVVASLVTEQGL